MRAPERRWSSAASSHLRRGIGPTRPSQSREGGLVRAAMMKDGHECQPCIGNHAERDWDGEHEEEGTIDAIDVNEKSREKEKKNRDVKKGGEGLDDSG
jgi:hypothetical protein